MLNPSPPTGISSTSPKSVVDFHSSTFARQLSYFEMLLFKSVPISELNYWVKGEKDEKKCPNLNILTQFVNKVTRWVSSEVVSSSNLKHRQTIIKHFITILQHCYELKNFTGVLEILMGLKHFSITRLKASWNLPEKYTTIFQQIAPLGVPENNWRVLRKHISDALGTQFGCVPYIGLFLSDLTFIKDGGGGKLENGHIGWDKNMKLYSTLHTIEALQAGDIVDVQPDPYYQFYFCSELNPLDEPEIIKRSKSFEPPQ
uniref:Ras-GEF domain-containing protein n=1 Tax=Arcella intermedia TaxID=1963864 RepID=A0A6B2LEN8_9EUKA